MASRAEKLEGLCEDLCDALAWILPLAKGYAAEHQVGSNSGLCIEAEDTLRKARAALALPADTPAQPAPDGAGEAVAWAARDGFGKVVVLEPTERRAKAQSVRRALEIGGGPLPVFPLYTHHTPRAEAAPGHTDLMVTPESVGPYVAAEAVRDACAKACDERAAESRRMEALCGRAKREWTDLDLQEEVTTEAVECAKACRSLPLPAASASAVPAWRDSFPPTHYCRECKALWRRWPDGSWSLVTAACGKCCDNVPMGEQIVALGEACAAPASAEAVLPERKPRPPITGGHKDTDVPPGLPLATSAEAALTFSALRVANVPRVAAFGQTLDAWSPMEWACAAAGEMGELCNVLKKRSRKEDPKRPGHDVTGKPIPTLRDAADEIADVVIYLDLLGAALGIDMGEAVARKWNEVSEKMGHAPRLMPLPSAPASAEAVAREAADLLAEMDAAWPPSQPPPHPKSFQGRFQARVRAVANALRACKAGGA